MTLTVTQIIHARSLFIISPEDGDIDPSRIEILTTLATNRLTKMIGGRLFTADEITELTSLIVMDMLQNEHGKGTIISEAVTDNNWRVNIKTSSQWMDEALAMVAEYDAMIAEHAVTVSTTSLNFDGVYRNDAHCMQHRRHF